MNYKRIYDRIVARAKERVLECYTERHHIVPRCLNGTDEPDNLVDLTPEEHYVCHQLLAKMYPYHPGLIHAAGMMASCDRYGHRVKNKLYGWLKRRMSESRTGKPRPREMYTEEYRRKLSEARKGKKLSAETKRKISEAGKGRKLGKPNISAEERLRRSLALKAMNQSEEQRRRVSEARRGVKMSDETKRKLSEIAKARHARRRAIELTVTAS